MRSAISVRLTRGVRRISLLAIPLLILQSTASPAFAQGAERPTMRERCPGASQWITAHSDQGDEAMQERDARRTLIRPDLVNELQTRFDEEQVARRRMLAERFSVSSNKLVRRLDAENQRWLIDWFAKDGFPTAEQIGEHGLHLTWLLVHHADSKPGFQRAALADFKRRYEAGEVNPQDLSQLSDRVAVKFGDPQPYGTQRDWAKGGVEVQDLSPSEIERIDANRKALGLMSLADYGCMMNAFRGKQAE